MTPSQSVGALRLPIFLYSGFRSSSTWLWTKFRAHDELLCYYEPFNEQLAALTTETIREARPSGWRSRHPEGAPYALEYEQILGDGVGVPHFPLTRNLGDRYIGAAGVEGPLDADIAGYVQGLIKHAEDRGRVPLLSCTRLLGRASGLRAAFGGYHVLLIRNLFQQWNSFAGQARFGNWYFLDALYSTLELAERDPIVERLVDLFSVESRVSFASWVSPENFDKVFCYSIGFHLYYLMIARRSADLVINANALAAPDGEYRDSVVARLRSDIGINIDLADVREQVDFPLHPLSSTIACTQTIDGIVSMLITNCQASADEQHFLETLVSDLWRAHEIFGRQTSSAFEYCAVVEQKFEDLTVEATERARSLDENSQGLRATLQKCESELEKARAEGSRKSTAMQSRLAEQDAEIQAAAQTISHERAERALQEASFRRDIKQLSDELTEARKDIVSTRGSLHDTKKALNTIQAELKAERALVKQLHDSATMREAAMANVTAVNLGLTDQISSLKRTGAELARNLAAEQIARVQVENRIQRIFDDDSARHRLEMVLATLMRLRGLRSILPKRFWQQKLEDSLRHMPGFETAFEASGLDATPSGLADAIWSAVIDLR